MTSRILKAFMFVVVASLALAACDSAEERAEARYQSGLELIEAGDFDRAIVELRSVFDLNPSHREARTTLARLLLEHQNNRQGAYSQYLRLAEQYPDDLEARIALTEIAFFSNNLDEVARHGAVAEELAPDDPRVRVLTVMRAYVTAVSDQDNATRRDQARLAQQLMADQSDNEILRSILIDSHIRDGDFDAALASIDWLLERNPEDVRIWRQRLNILGQTQDFEAMEAQLKEMVLRFEDDDSHKANLVRFYLARQQPDEAEAYLRDLVAQDPERAVARRIDLIRFLAEFVDKEDARAEVDLAIADHPDEQLFHVLGAGLDFDAGRTDVAIATLERVLTTAEDNDETREIKVTLARMFLQTGNDVRARALVEEVLSQDTSNPNALKMRAAWLIDADDTDGAISALRDALDRAPEDAQAMSLMASAYSRAGQTSLSRDFLALAVEASGNAPAETLRFARVLVQEERYRPAEDILLPSLRLNPDNVELLVTLGQVYLRLDDMSRAQQVAQGLRDLGTPQARLAADGLEAERINRESGPESAVAYLEGIANSSDASLASRIALIRARLGTNDADGALELARELQAAEPDNDQITAVLASVTAASGDLAAAEALYMQLVEADPARPRVWLELARLRARQSDFDGASAMIDRGLEATPEAANLLWARASYFEREGDIDGAIDIYERLYEQDSSSLVIANNLASLLVTYRADPASIDRAWIIARRLRDVEAPALQDTYGWILHLRGESQEAVRYLEAAAAGLTGDPIVQFHLAEIYNALGRTDDALAQYRVALKVAGPTDTRGQFVKAREQVAALEAAAAQSAND